MAVARRVAIRGEKIIFENIALLPEFAAQYPSIWGGFLFLSGLAFGSFFNVVIHRLPLMMAHAEGINLCFPASFCPQCREPIAWRDNIPLLSFLFLKGRSRCCGEPISPRYPLMELATGALFMLVGYLIPPGIPLLGGLLLLSVLLILATIDAQTQLLPDGLTLPLLWAGLLFNLSDTFAPLAEAVIGAMAGYLSLWSVYWVFRLLTGKEALGYGDFKLLAALGAWLGWQALPQTLLLASASGLVWTLLQRLITRQSFQQPLAFGPWLALAGGGIFLWSQV
ncbi:Type 4 prepilin-like proteins leader peptide-processing enzyme [Klebsiella pasteurii]|uniref:Prepilin leader peptidase/N-methyltransferase n=2 Tax=Klebsiella TaxID=570 RepID=A0A9Q9S5Z4_9ENTR|nr:Type 4 prepilin-like proteins leader peptide-processing enzyme [Klebsiella pasteurii]VUS36962.1 Type 4 prepilin-like proteins leader peptide-processing enzyme [Klebsiella pasteurii]VUT21612.1 Type 4 prepilin-like proteins leader peptide-processing enzyme [Klebsiella pasteurii]